MSWRWDYASAVARPRGLPSALWALAEGIGGLLFLAGLCFAGYCGAVLVEVLRP